MKEIVFTADAPAPIGPYSQAVRCGNLIFVSGQLPLNPKTGGLVQDIAAATEQVFENLKAILATGGSGLERVLKITVYLKDLAQFAEVNKVYSRYFSDQPPARTTVQVAALPKDAGIEIDAIAEC